MVPSGTVPRRVGIERQKRAFACDEIGAILADEHSITGVDLLPGGDLASPGGANGASVMSSAPYLPLEHFDNRDLDERTPEEWSALGIDADGLQHGTPGLTLRPKVRGALECTWEPCIVTGYESATERFIATVGESDSAVSIHVPRIHLMFVAESPRAFAARVADACAARRTAEAQLRYNLIVDCMPVQDTDRFDPTRMQGILEKAKGATSFHNSEDPVVSELFLEIDIGHARAQNRLLLNRFIEQNPEAYPGVSVPPSPVEVKIRNLDIPDYSFQNALEKIQGYAFANQLDVMRAIQLVKAACAPAEAMQLFSTGMSKQMKLEDFQNAQLSVYDGVQGYLRNSWVPSCLKAVQDTIGKIARGWFDMHTMSQEVYDVSRLRKFHCMIKLIMQDVLRSIVVHSCTSFQKMVLQGSAAITAGGSEQHWDTSRGFSSALFAPPSGPLWALTLVSGDAGFQLSTPVEPFKEAILGIFNDGISHTYGIPDIEPLLMPKLFWVGTPQLESVDQQEEWLNKIRMGMATAIDAHKSVLMSYVAMYEKFNDLAILDVEKYLEEFMNEARDVSAIRSECLKHMKRRDEIEASVPSEVVIGLFHIDTGTARSFLLDKLNLMTKALLEHLGKSLRKAADAVCKEYVEISAKLTEPCDGIEPLDEKETWMKSEMPELIKQLRARGSKALDDWDLLAEFKMEMSDEDFLVRWKTYGWPKKLEGVQAEVLEKNVEERERFKQNLVGNIQEFASRLNNLQKTVGGFYNHTDLKKTEAIAVDVRKIAASLAEAQKDASTYNVRQRLFGMPVTEYTELSKTVREFEPYKNLWLTTDDWIKSHKKWMSNTFTSLDPEALEQQINTASKVIHKCTRSLKDMPGCLEAASEVKGWIAEFAPYVPLIQALRNPGMRDRHWEQLSQKLGFEVKPDESFTFTHALEKGLQNHIDAIAKVGEFAGKEFGIEQALDKMEEEWKPMDLGIMPYKNTGTYIVAGVDEIIQQLDDHIVMTQAMSFSPYKKPFEDRIAIWEKKLLTSSDVIEEWLKVQQSWLYLEPIFSSDDIARQLPNENKRYQTMYTMWRKAMKGAHKTPNVITYCPQVKLLEDLRECNKLLDQVQKGLSAYLESKRGVFARFYFLSDDELLEILSQTKDPTAVQPHMRKCFDNIKSLTFEDDLQMSAFASADGEVVKFNETLYPKGNVEEWLLEVERVMRLSIREIFTHAWAAYGDSERVDWVVNQGWPGQIVIAGCQMAWTNEVSAAIEAGEMKDYCQKSEAQLADLVIAIRGKLGKIQRKVVSALIVIEVHAKDVSLDIRDDNVTSSSAFEWIKQLRYYWEENEMGSEELRVKCVSAAFDYGYEYLGNSGRLVITPLTDRIYITLTGALELIYGGAPAGPAGTGKTETTKDLAKALAIQCVVFNCSDQLDYMAMAKFFKGLASAGAWACFDEFNRIDIEVLSVVAQQVITIQLAIKSKETRFMFEGSDLQLRWTASAFITMNPGYAGRTELPDNLAALFRPVACMVPDYTMIAEIFLYSFGFADAKPLSGKITTVFKLSSEQLSSQYHYDFGMRAVKTVIVAAGNLKRTQGDVMAEDQIVLSAMKDVNEPKFLQADLLLFHGIVSDLFPKTEHKAIDYGDFKAAINDACREMHLQPVDGFVTKVIQLYETTCVRHGLMLVGPTGSGKTRDREVLTRACTALAEQGKLQSSGDPFTKVLNFVLNPKSITMGQLYGAFDPLTHEWTDGILSTLVRRGVAQDDDVKKWFVFDGPVDAIWIENMNTVLDDNKKLCLASGEIIALTGVMTMMFEVEDLSVASPATVSRCGMVYLEPSIFGEGEKLEKPLQPFVDTWFETNIPELIEPYREQLVQLFNTYLEGAIEYVRLNVREMNSTVDANLCFSMLKLLRCFFEPFELKEEMEITDEARNAIGTWIEYWFIFSLIWSVGASCYEDGRAKFDVWLREAMKTAGSAVPFPDECSVYDYCMVDDGARATVQEDEEEESGRYVPQHGWRLWTATFEVPVIDPSTQFSKNYCSYCGWFANDVRNGEITHVSKSCPYCRTDGGRQVVEHYG